MQFPQAHHRQVTGTEINVTAEAGFTDTNKRIRANKKKNRFLPD